MHPVIIKNFKKNVLHQFVNGTATDRAGNSANVTVSDMRIDKTLPVITITSSEPRDYRQSENITLNFSAVDALSGIDSIAAYLDSRSVTNGQVIDLRTLTLAEHAIMVNASDRAGNSAGKSVSFNIRSINATVDIKPDTLNKGSQSDKNAVTVYIEIPGYDVKAIDVGTVTLIAAKGSVKAQFFPAEVGDYDGDGIPDRMVKFDMQAVIAIFDVGDRVKITIKGKGEGATFEGFDEIRVIDNGKVRENMQLERKLQWIRRRIKFINYVPESACFSNTRILDSGAASRERDRDDSCDGEEEERTLKGFWRREDV